MRNSVKKNILRVIIFTLLFVFLFSVVKGVFTVKQKDGEIIMWQFYSEPADSIDVLLMGTSHMYEGVSPAILYEDHGIASFCLASGGQPLINTYYYLKEALKTQTPKVVVLDMYAVTNPPREKDVYYNNTEHRLRAVNGLRLSWNKIEAIIKTMPWREGLDALLGVPMYHMRYFELTEDDLCFFPWYSDWSDKGNENVKGFTFKGSEVMPVGTPDVKGIVEEDAFDKISETYLLKIIELCKKNNIQLLLISTPYFLSDHSQMYYNRVARIAEENGVPYINYNLLYDELEFNFSTDIRDLGGHLTVSGVEKLSHALGDYLVDNYDLADRRGDPAYQSYDDAIEKYARLREQNLPQEDELSKVE